MSKATNMTINEVARLAGVSKKSVSRVLNDEAGVSEKTRAHIQQIMASVGYVPDRRARALASSKSLLLGLAYNNRNPNFVLELLKGAQEAANAAGYEIVMHTVSGDDAADELIRFMRRSACDGLILTPPLSESATLVAALTGQDWPVVRIAGDNADFELPQIRYNDRTAALTLANQLLKLGHESIAFIGGPMHAGPTMRRLAGVKDAVSLAGLELEKRLVRYGDFTFDSGKEEGAVLLGQGRPPTAIICANDEMAAGVYHSAAELGISIPGQLSVTGFDDSPVASQLWPPLTSVRQPVADMTGLAVRMVIDGAQRAGSGVEQFDAQIMYRASVSGP